MWSKLRMFFVLLLLQTVTASLIPTLVERQDPQCTNGPKTRACWKNGYSIATDFDKKFPTTGNVVQYDLEISNGTCNPDGNGDRLCLLINNQYPGPLIRATWGDTLSITVKNSMLDNGTSIHWHGVRQFHSTGDDGVNGITECPLAPGDTKTYTFLVTQFGTSWYHSHYSAQYGDGVVGPMIFDGPASANYDIDLGPYTLTDWYYATSSQVNAITSQNLQNQRPPPSADNVLVNGTNKNLNGGGQYGQVTVQKGKKYRLRLINSSSDNYFRISLDNHVMQVMTSDFIPIKPFMTETLLIGIGQRYDVVITANQAAGNYWFRADVAGECRSANKGAGRAIWSYKKIKPATPTSTGFTSPNACVEPQQMAPYWIQRVPSDSFASNLHSLHTNITRQVIIPGHDSIVVWALNDTSLNVDWKDPTLNYLMASNESFPKDFHVIPTVSEGGWNFWVIQQPNNVPPIPHPIHLHGHDFFVLGQGSGTFDAVANFGQLNFATAPRRDTATVPAGGWMVMAFESNNPGTWLMHCHIAWHVSEGLAVQFLEAPDQIAFPDQAAFQRTCDNWRAYQSGMYYPKDDSGV